MKRIIDKWEKKYEAWKTTKETDEFYYFEKDLATPKTSFDNIKAKISSSYELVINFNKSKYVND